MRWIRGRERRDLDRRRRRAGARFGLDDATAGTIRIARGVSLDLGATAKALAADRAAARRTRAAGCGVLVSLGGDIAIAGPRAGRRLARPRHRRSPRRRRRSRPVDRARGGRPGHLEHGRAPVADRRRASSHHLLDPATGAAPDSVLADGQRRRRLLAWTPTSPARRRSSAGARRPSGSSRWGCRAGWSDDGGTRPPRRRLARRGR